MEEKDIVLKVSELCLGYMHRLRERSAYLSIPMQPFPENSC